jgi:hypothetical protein
MYELVDVLGISLLIALVIYKIVLQILMLASVLNGNMEWEEALDNSIACGS